PRIVVLISGNGSNLQALIDASQRPPSSLAMTSEAELLTLPADIALVVSNKSKAFGLERAAKAGIPTWVHTLKPYRERHAADPDPTHAPAPRAVYDRDLALGILERVPNPQLIVLAGWMHILSPAFLDTMGATCPVINLHPALPGAYDGIDAIGRAFRDFQAGKTQHTGIMVHRVIPEVDRGDVVLSCPVPILPEDTQETLEARMHEAEHRLIVQGAAAVLAATAP
ncbi:phosphoribosylglycinamide formyltransferase, partial [Caulochytrium protostelioides]